MAEPARPTAGSRAALTRDDVRQLVQRATTAPSAGNMQPWRFVWNGTLLDCCLERSRAGTLLDFESAASYLALGSAVETLWHAATDAGLDAHLHAFPEGTGSDVVCRVEFTRRAPGSAPSPMCPWLEARCTNRRLGRRVPLDAAHSRALDAAARAADAELQLATEPSMLEEIGTVLGRVDRVRFLSDPLRREAFSEMRWNDLEARTTRDGVYIGTLEINAFSRLALSLLRRPKAAAVLRKLGNGAVLDSSAKRWVAAASAVGLLSVAGTDSSAYFRGGRALQRVWLTATSLGLAVHPMAVAPYLFARVERGGGEGLGHDEIDATRGLRARFNDVFRSDPERAEVFLFRIAKSGPPRVRSLRRSVDDVLSWA